MSPPDDRPVTATRRRPSLRRRVVRAVRDVARDLGVAGLTGAFALLTLIVPRRAYPTVVRAGIRAGRIGGGNPWRDLIVEQSFCRGYGLFRRGWPARVDVTGLEHFESAHGQGRGVVMWVMGFLDQTALNLTLDDAGHPVSFVASENHGIYSPRFTSRVLAAPIINRAVFRSIDRLIVIPDDGRKGYIRELCSILERDHGTVGMKGDVTDSPGAVEASYRGRPAAFPTGAASLAFTTGAPLLTGAVIRHGVLHHEVVIDPPIDLPVGSPRQEFMTKVVEQYAARLEARAAAHPESRPASRFDSSETRNRPS